MADDPNAMTSADDYSNAVIKKTRWGQTEAGATGGWVTIWHLSMDTSHVPKGGVDVVADNDRGFESRLAVEGPGVAVLVVETVEDAMSAEYYPMTFKAFGIINDQIGIIEKIEGLPRDWYAPFRSRQG